MTPLSKLVLVFCFVLVLSSCTQKESVFFENSKCGQPCWRNIAPGISKEEATNIINQSLDIDKNSIKWSLQNGIDSDISCSWKFVDKKEVGGGIAFKKDKVVSYSLRYIDEFTLDDFIKELGNPSKVIIYSTIGGGMIYSEISILYTQKGLCLLNNPSLSEKSTTYVINQNEKIKSVVYVDPQKDPNQLLYGCLSGFAKSKFILGAQDWVGYGEYNILQQR